MDYREFLSTKIDACFGAGRGKWRRFAEQIKISPTLLSLIWSGQRRLSTFQAVKIAEILKLNKAEFEMLIEMIHLESEVNPKVRAIHTHRIQHLTSEVSRDRQLTNF